MDWSLIGSLFVLVALAMFFGALLRDVLFAMGGAAWSQRAFSRSALAAVGWNEDTDGFEAEPAPMTAQNVRPGLAWRVLRSGRQIGTPGPEYPVRTKATKAARAVVVASSTRPHRDPARGRHAAPPARHHHRARRRTRPATQPGYLSLLAATDAQIARFDALAITRA